MKQKIVQVIRHLMFEDLGSFEEVLIRNNYIIEYVEAGSSDAYKPDRLEADLLVILGGPISANDVDDFPWLLDEIRFIKARLTMKKPIIGICLGSQLIAKACGAKVFSGTVKEIGWSKLTFTPSAMSHPINSLVDTHVLHWHGDTFILPDGATLLASSLLYENQAFAIGNYCLGLQFHPEVIKNKLELWYIANASEVRDIPDLNIARLRADGLHYIDQMHEKALIFWDKTLKFLSDNDAN